LTNKTAGFTGGFLLESDKRKPTKQIPQRIDAAEKEQIPQKKMHSRADDEEEKKDVSCDAIDGTVKERRIPAHKYGEGGDLSEEEER